MQLIGIYLKNGKPNVCKCLTPGWYPFGTFSNCHEQLIQKNFFQIKKEIDENKKFCNQLYGFVLENEKNIPITVNCIVGKNGTGKSTLINILYRLINNFSVKFHDSFKEFNNSFEPVWSSGFEAELYYECNGKIGCIISEQKINKEIPVRVFFDDQYVLFENQMPNREIIEFIYKSFFYTIATDYSLYASSELEENWKPNLYHKNDGYHTPIVLLPFRDSNNIDINKEKELAKERIEILSLLLELSHKELIKGYQPDSIQYRLKNSRNYKNNLQREIEKFYKPYSFKVTQKELQAKCDFFLKTLSEIWYKKIGIIKKNQTVIDVALLYLSYKTIKTCINYDIYSKLNIFKHLEKIYDISNLHILKTASDEKELNKEKENINNIINIFLNSQDHTTKKIRHTYYFLNNDIYMGASQIDGIIIAKEFLKYHKQKRNTYFEISEDLLPPIYDTVFFFKKTESKTKIKLDSLSSGELQFINSLSYIIYHLVNLQSIQRVSNEGKRIKYTNINLIFDEAEIYYHPEYQRKFVFELINLLNNCGFFELFHFSITIVTHSPFMVSDIPESNIACIKTNNNMKSTYIKTDGNTFSANYYDLIENQFFVEAPTGGIPEKIFKKIINDYESFKTNDKPVDLKKYTRNKDFYNQLIKYTGDTYFKKTISFMISNMQNVSKE